MNKLLTHFFFLVILFLSVSSCTAPLRFPKIKNNTVANLSIDWRYGKKVNDIYKPKIDSTMEELIDNFNDNNHSFQIHKKKVGEKAAFIIELYRGKFVGDGEIVASYVISTLGLIFAPISTESATNGQSISFFYYFPGDIFRYTAYLSPTITNNKLNRYTFIKHSITSDAMFTGKSRRMNVMCRTFYNEIYSILNNLDPTVHIGK